MIHHIAFIGFGTVGQGLCEILLEKQSDLKKQYNFEGVVVAVSDIQKGSVYCPKGLDIHQLLTLAQSGESLESYRCIKDCDKCEKGWDALKTIQDSNAHTICELSYTDVKTGEPAITHCKTAFQHGKNIVTSNKGPGALLYKDLLRMAKKNNVQFKIEGTVVSGTPVINLAQGPLAGCTISSIKGILNGTTNYILSEMESGKPYDEALKTAQELGYAEADPTGDVEGYDAMAKVIILANVLMGGSLSKDDVERMGMSQITSEMIQEAKSKNARWKLIGSITKSKGNIRASVKPEMIPLTHPLAGIMGATNALTFSTDLMGEITIVGAGAGRTETGFSILTDLLAINLIG